MASPWIPAPQQQPAERHLTGIALLIAVPLLSLILIRMIWSGSSLWFLMVGILLLGTAAVVFLARRPQELEYDRQMGVRETHRAPLILTGLGVLFLAMLLLPNFSGGSDSPSVGQQQPSDGTNDVADVALPPAQDAAPEQNAPPAEEPEPSAPTGGQTYVVKSGDSLWAIAQQFGTTVEAIVAANQLKSAEELQVGQELRIPAAEEAVAP